jgi:hypothetical protein
LLDGLEDGTIDLLGDSDGAELKLGASLGAPDTLGESDGIDDLLGLELGTWDFEGVEDGTEETLGCADGVFQGGTSTGTLKRVLAFQHLEGEPGTGQVDVLAGLQRGVPPSF